MNVDTQKSLFRAVGPAKTKQCILAIKSSHPLMHDDVMGIFAFHGERMSSYLKKCQKMRATSIWQFDGVQKSHFKSNKSVVIVTLGP